MKKISTFMFVFFLLTQFAFSQTIETIGVGAFGSPTSTLTFTDLENIDHVVVEAIFKATSVGIVPNGPVTFSDADESYNSSAVPVEYIFTPNGTDYGASPHYFQATFNTIDAGGITLNQLNNLGAIHSFIAYVYRNVDNDFVSFANYDHGFYYHNGSAAPGTYTFPLDAVAEPRDLSAMITISEMAGDSRICVITVSAGGVTVTDTINEPDPELGPSLNIVPFTLYDVPGDATELTVSIYSPNIPYNSGDSFITGGVILDVESPNDDCGPCEGQMTSLTLEYLGNLNNATIKVYTKKVEPGKLIATFNNVNQGDLLTFVGIGNDNKLGSKVRITINNSNNYTEIHTSCSQPIEVGMTFGDFLLVAGTSHEGGELCDDGGGGGDDCGPCEGQMTSLTLEYQGNQSNATIKVYTKKVEPGKLIATFTNVNQGDLLSFTGTGDDQKLGSKVRITINNSNNYTEIHTSCSQPIEVGMTFGDFLLVAGTSHEGGDLCDDGGGGGEDCGPCEGQMTSLTLEYQGDETNATIKVYKKKVQSNNLIATFTNVNDGDLLTFTGTGDDNKLGSKVRLTVNNNNLNYTEIHTSCSQPIEVGMTFDDFLLVAGTSHEGGDLCENGGSGGGDDCGPCDGQMTSLTLEYLGNTDDVTIKVYKDKVQSDKLIATFTNVDEGDELTFIGTGNDNKLGAKVRLTINNNNCNYTEIHTSCSQPIEVGMVYDNKFLLVAGTSHEGGDLCDDGYKSSTIFVFTEITTSQSYIHAYPNPIVSGSTVEFEVNEEGNTSVELINLQGQVVKQLFNNSTEPGNKYTLLLNASDLNTGIYILKMTNGSDVVNQKISIVK